MLNSQQTSRNWISVVDSGLLPHLLAGKTRVGEPWPAIGVAIVGLFAIIALAGPVWEKLPQKVFRQQAAVVILLDLSRSMDATDIKPSRLTRARHKIADILTLRREGRTALVVYAADAFVVTPLTEDGETIKALLPSLSTDIMPAQGSRVDRALRQALELFDNEGVRRGDVLIVSDGISAIEMDEVERVLEQAPGVRLSILATGSESGAPIPLSNGGFMKDSKGSIVITRMRVDNLAKLVQKGAGELVTISTDDRDIEAILKRIRRNATDSEIIASDVSADIWREQGPWLILLVLPFVALIFRRGVLFLVPLMLLPIPPEAGAFGWDHLWQNQNQRGSVQFEKGDHEQAAELFNHPGWKASALYRAGSYDEAVRYWGEQDSDNAHYNRANALARLGRFEDAIKAYERALDMNPQHQDASYNKRLLEDAMQQQQQQQQEGQGRQNQQQGNQQQQSDSSGEGQQSSTAAESQRNAKSRQDEPDQQVDSRQQRQTEAETSTTDSIQSGEQTGKAEARAEMEQAMSEQAANQWLRRIPDDPGGLLRRKFIYQYRNRDDHSVEDIPW
jgi:Ca-activated chloride channel family protein